MQGFEPMALGSPSSNPHSPPFAPHSPPFTPHSPPFTPHSPPSGPHPSSPNSKTRFQDNTPKLIPSYLMGDYQKRSRSFLHQPTTNASTTPTQPLNYPPNHLPSPYERPRTREHKGPPVQNLHEAFITNRNNNTLNSSSLYDSPSTAPSTHPSQQHNPHSYLINKTDPFLSPITMNQKDSIFNHPDIDPSSSFSSSPLEHCWVTIFGFPNDATSSILQEFSELGCVLKHQLPDKGNWLHVLYENKIQAKKALCRNGRVLGGCVMVGVLPCSDKSITDTHMHTHIQRNNLDLSSSSRLDRALNNTEPRKKNAGLISKTLDYVLGW